LKPDTTYARCASGCHLRSSSFGGQESRTLHWSRAKPGVSRLGRADKMDGVLAETPSPSPPSPTLPSELPVLPLRRTVLFPLTIQPLQVNRAVSIESVNRALGADRLILLILQEDDAEDPGPDNLKKVGTVGIIRQMAKAAGGLNIIV